MTNLIDRDAALAIEGQLAKSMAHFLRVEQWQAYKAGVQEYRDAIAALPSVTVVAKPLDFDEWDANMRVARTAFGRYRIGSALDGGFDVVGPNGWRSPCSSERAALKACQDHYEASIRAALEPVTQPAPDVLPEEERGIMQARIDALETENANLLRTLQGQPAPTCLHLTVEMARACPICTPSPLHTPAPAPAAIREAALREAADLVNRIVDGVRVTVPCPDGKKGCLVHHFRMEDGPTAKAILALIPKGAADV